MQKRNRTLVVAAGANIFSGADVVIDNGFAKPAHVAPGLKFGGVAKHPADNRDGADGDITVEAAVECRALFVDDIATLIPENLDATAYWLDDQTVSFDPALAATHSAAGTLFQIEGQVGFFRPPVV
jgi:hypothetical protein